MITHLFYLTGFIFIWRDLGWIVSPMEKTLEYKRFRELSKANKGKTWLLQDKEYKSALASKIPLLIVFFWMFAGLLTVQWDSFLAMLLFNFLIVAPLSRLTKFSFAFTGIDWLNSVIGFAFGVFVIVNHYHLHISTSQYFADLLK